MSDIPSPAPATVAPATASPPTKPTKKPTKRQITAARAAQRRALAAKRAKLRAATPYLPFTLDDTTEDEFRTECAVGSTCVGIAAWFGVHRDTLDAAVQKRFGVPFSEFLAIGRERSDHNVRRLAHTHANAGDVRALIFLAKAQVGMVERVALTGKNGAPLEAAPVVRQSIIIGDREIIF
jgi:hypothetical protein